MLGTRSRRILCFSCLPILNEKYLQYADVISQAAIANQIRWNGEDFWENIYENYDFLEERISILTDCWLKEGEYCQVHVVPGIGVWGCFAVKKGDCIPVEFEEIKDGWFVLGTNEPFDVNQPIYEDMTVYHRENCKKMLQAMESDPTEQHVPNEQTQDDKDGGISLQRAAPVMIIITFLCVLCVIDEMHRKRTGE